MLKKIISFTISILITFGGVILLDNLLPILTEMGYEIRGNSFLGFAFPALMGLIFGVFFFAWLGLVLGPFLANALFRFSERFSSLLSRIPTSDILVMIFGVGIGLILANLIGSPFSRLPIFGPYIPIVLSLFFSVIGANLANRKSKDIIEFFNRLGYKRPLKEIAVEAVKAGPLGDRLYSANKLLDTSVIIDGRIMDIVATGFLEGQLVVPNFVVEELQKLADSADSMKRAKGRRGLDLVQDMQVAYKNQVVIIDNDYDDVSGVDAKLVRLAKDADCTIITNDYNLNKVAGIQGITVLNINELANAIKTNVMSGEEMSVFLIKEGKEQGQAVGYMPDGTMIVVENARRFIGSSINVIVTSVLQTNAGRLIFAKAVR